MTGDEWEKTTDDSGKLVDWRRQVDDEVRLTVKRLDFGDVPAPETIVGWPHELHDRWVWSAWDATGRPPQQRIAHGFARSTTAAKQAADGWAKRR